MLSRRSPKSVHVCGALCGVLHSGGFPQADPVQRLQAGKDYSCRVLARDWCFHIQWCAWTLLRHLRDCTVGWGAVEGLVWSRSVFRRSVEERELLCWVLWISKGKMWNSLGGKDDGVPFHLGWSALCLPVSGGVHWAPEYCSPAFMCISWALGSTLGKRSFAYGSLPLLIDCRHPVGSGVTHLRTWSAASPWLLSQQLTARAWWPSHLTSCCFLNISFLPDWMRESLACPANYMLSSHTSCSPVEVCFHVGTSELVCHSGFHFFQILLNL